MARFKRLMQNLTIKKSEKLRQQNNIKKNNEFEHAVTTTAITSTKTKTLEYAVTTTAITTKQRPLEYAVTTTAITSTRTKT